MTRFSKTSMVANLDAKVAKLKAAWGFDPNNGTAQLEGKGEAAWLAYGEYRLCLRLIEEIEDGRV